MLGIAVALAAEIAPFDAAQPDKAIYFWADFYSVSRVELYETIKCESRFRPNAVGKFGELGIAQIYLKYHPSVSKEEALDPDFSIRWMAEQFSKGDEHLWTCWRKKFG